MFSFKTKKAYQSPRTKVVGVDLDGLILSSRVTINADVYEIEHIYQGSEDNEEPMYFPS